MKHKHPHEKRRPLSPEFIEQQIIRLTLGLKQKCDRARRPYDPLLAEFIRHVEQLKQQKPELAAYIRGLEETGVQ